MIAAILGLSLTLQVAAALLALRLIRVTGRRGAWMLIAAAVSLMAGRRVLTLSRLLSSRDGPAHADLQAELVALAISGLMLGGIAAIGPVFQAIRRSEMALAESERRHRSVVTALAEGVILRDEKGVIRACNPAAERIFGLPADQLLGRSAVASAGASPPRNRSFPDESEPALATLRTGRPCSDIVTAIDGPGGSLAWISINTQPLLRVGEERACGVVSSITDVTERKRMEEVLREIAQGVSSSTGAAFFRSLVEHLARSLGVDFVFVAELGEAPERLARTIAVWGDGAPQEDFEYEMEHAPGAGSKDGNCIYASEAGARFPHDRLLARLGIQGYCASHLMDSAGRPMGLLVAMDRAPFAEPQRVQAMVQIFAVRVAAELERKRTEEVLREKEAGLLTAQRIARLGNWEWDLETGRVRLSEHSMGLLGLAEVGEGYEAVLGLVHPQDRELVRLAVRDALATGEPFGLEHRVVLPDGGEGHVHTRGEIQRSPDGRPLRVFGTFQDITERRRAEEALRSLSRAVEQTADSVLITDREGLIQYVNPAFEEQTGYSRANAVGQTPRLLKSGLHEPAFYEEFWGRILAGGSYRGVFINRKRNGELYHEDKVISPLRDGSGEIGQFVSTGRDITERMRAEEEQATLQAAIAKAAKEWQQTFDAIEAPVLVLDLAGAVRRLNDAARQLSGRDYAGAIGRRLEELGAGHPWAAAAKIVAATAATRAGEAAQACDPRAGRTWELSASFDGGARAGEERVVLVIRDITATVRLQESLRRSETLAAMGSLVGGVAHQVRNPLFGISSTLDAFEARFGRKEEFARYTTILRGELERLSSLMKELLEYGRPFDRELVPSRVGDTLAQAMRSCLSLARRSKVRLVSTIAADDAVVAMDSQRLVQVFQNLIENAIQHSPEGAKVTIEAGRALEAGREWFQCAIRDCGPGFREDDLPRIFEPFFTRRRGGTGLGLPIAQRIVEEHGGQISPANAPEGGAVMSVRLPLAIP